MTLNQKLEQFLCSTFSKFPWPIEVTDWSGNSYQVGQGNVHWNPEYLHISIHTKEAGKYFLSLNGQKCIEKYLSGEIDIDGNLSVLSSLKYYADIKLNFSQLLKATLSNYLFQTMSRAKVNVKSHYDISQNILEVYLDKKYMAYSCAMFEEPELSIEQLPQLVKVGAGEQDTFDSLEKAQWRKFKDAVDFLEPKPGDTMLDVGCGYTGQLTVALENYQFGKVVGWTHSNNQVVNGEKDLHHFERGSWELNEGDYRQDKRIYNHITSTGMVSHVGPRGLVPYVRNIRKRIKQGGHYVHHSLMTNYSAIPLDAQVGIAFNKKYVWPGFHWFTLSQHIKALEENGFTVLKVLNLRQQYCKTLTAWYQRMLMNEKFMIDQMGITTYRAWKLYLGAGAGPDSGDVNRIYCRAI